MKILWTGEEARDTCVSESKMLIATRLMLRIGELIKLNEQILKAIRLRQPGMVFLTLVSEKDGMLKFKLVLPAAGASDVISRELSFKIGESEPESVALDGSATETAEFSGADGATVTGSLVDIDDAGNDRHRETLNLFSWTRSHHRPQAKLAWSSPPKSSMPAKRR